MTTVEFELPLNPACLNLALLFVKLELVCAFQIYSKVEAFNRPIGKLLNNFDLSLFRVMKSLVFCLPGAVIF